jgi:hypothetical protein
LRVCAQAVVVSVSERAVSVSWMIFMISSRCAG